MIILGLKDISLSFGTINILENITFNIQDSERVGLVGVNGAGKSTLFKIINEVLLPDAGEIYKAKDIKIGYLEQNSGLDSTKCIWDELISTFSELIQMEQRIKQLEKEMSSAKDESLLLRLMNEYDRFVELFSRGGGYEYNSRTKGILRGMGFDENQFQLKINTLSGGQKTRLALARLLLDEPDLLLLDEPTNHLDIETLEWLEDYLKAYRKSVLVISHDRYFLDKITNRTIEIENCRCKMFNGNYSEYTRLKAIDRETQQKHYDLQQKEIARMEAFIEQQRRWNREKNIIAAESRQKAIDRIERIEKPGKLPDKIKMRLRSGISSGNDVLFVEKLSKEYPGKPLFQDISFNLKKGERAFILGPNGCGKTTLLKLISGRLPQTSGSTEYGRNVVLGYYDQELMELDESNTVIDEVWSANEKLTQTEIRNTLASFLFKGDDVSKQVSTLSGGEKSRVALVKLMLSEANLLLLDEPTNHLDVNSREVLEEALRNYDGTILAVSHDRYFISKLGSRIIEMNNNSLFDFRGNYEAYLDYKNKVSQDEIDQSTKGASLSKLEHIESKEEKARIRRIERQLEETEQEIDEIENRLESIVLEMENESIQSDHVKLLELQNEHDSISNRLEELYQLWETLSNES